MSFPKDSWLTVDAVCHVGACVDGARKWRALHARGATALPVDEALALARSDDQRSLIAQASERSGYGSGSGDGYGYGYGSGYGYGYG